MNKGKFLSYSDAKDFANKSNIKTEMQWKMERKSLPKFIPREPWKVYKEEWTGFADWLGTKNIRGGCKKYKVNEDFFKVWSHDMAYILGFWWADGYMRMRTRKLKNGDEKSSYIFGISQNTRDKYLLEKILKSIDSNNKIYTPKTRPNGSHFEISSKIIYNDIIKIGGSPNKSKSISMPDIPKEYLPDFIRGLFDGDGCIYQNKKKGYRTSYICSGSCKLIAELKSILDNVGISGKIQNNGNKKSPVLKLFFGVKLTRKLGKFMYNNCGIKLNRKFEKFLDNGEFIWLKATEQ